MTNLSVSTSSAVKNLKNSFMYALVALSLGLPFGTYAANEENELTKAIIHNKIDEIKKLSKDANLLNQADIAGETPLHFAVLTNDPKIITLLLEAGAKIDAAASQKMQPIHLAAMKGHLEAVKVLCKYNADITAEMEDGGSPLFCAIQFGQKEVALYLISLVTEQDINKAHTSSLTPLHLAVLLGNKEIVEALLKRNANVNVNATIQAGALNINLYPLHYAAISGNLDITIMLLEHGADVNALSGAKTAETIALESRNLPVAHYLAKYRKSIQQPKQQPKQQQKSHKSKK